MDLMASVQKEKDDKKTFESQNTQSDLSLSSSVILDLSIEKYVEKIENIEKIVNSKELEENLADHE